MEYFLIETEKGNNIPYSINKNMVIDIRNINQENSYKIPNCSVVEMKIPQEIFLPNVLLEPMFMVDRVFAEVIEMYMTTTIFKTIYLLNKESGINRTYYLPILEEIDCLATETKKSHGGLDLFQIVIKKDIFLRPIFRVKGFLHPYVIGRMDLIESVLRRHVRGMTLTKLRME